MRHDPFSDYLANITSLGVRAQVETIIAAIRAAGSFEESIKWGHPYFASHGQAVVKLFVARAWINVYLFRGTELIDPEQLLESDPRSRMRKLRVHPNEPIPSGLTDLVSAARALT